MSKRDFDFRPNPTRAVHVFGSCDDDLLAKIVPSITNFRFEGSTPITVYINSPGGVIRSLEILVSCLWDADIEGHTHRIITVATGDAASAAATLLALGDYSIAHESSEIYFHGARFRELEITTESAAECAATLAHKNRQIAFRLANRVIRKLVHRYSLLCNEFEEKRKQPNTQKSDLDCFVECILERVNLSASQVVTEAYNKTKVALQLTENILSNVTFSKEQSFLEQDGAVFKAILDHEITQLSEKNWRLDEYGCSQLVQDYLLLRDYQLGDHQQSLDWIIKHFGMPFLSQDEFNEYSQKDEKEKLTWLSDTVFSRIRPFWYFTLRLCQQLQEGENRLSPADAYWIGAVDEVMGTELQGYRSIIENATTDEESASTLV
jgi:ATP-dependent protease ClpP protease subunit